MEKEIDKHSKTRFLTAFHYGTENRSILINTLCWQSRDIEKPISKAFDVMLKMAMITHKFLH